MSLRTNKACIYTPVSQLYMCVYTLAANSLDSHYDLNVFSVIVITIGIAVSHRTLCVNTHGITEKTKFKKLNILKGAFHKNHIQSF